MSLVFTGGDTDAVSLGTPAGLNNLSAFTYIAWIFRTGTVGAATTGIVHKGTFAGGNRRNLSIASGGGDVNFTVDRVTTDTNMSATGAAGSDANAWNCWAATFDTSNNGNLYKGTLASIMADPGVSVASAGSGATVADSALPQLIGSGSSGGSNSFPGRIGPVAIFNRKLTLAECIDWQFRPRPLSGCLAFLWLGANGTGTQPDWSGNGNSGAVTGAVVGADVPLGNWFGQDDAAGTMSSARPWLYRPHTKTLGAGFRRGAN